MIYLASALIGYLLGSIPFGLVITKLSGFGDIRHIGSGNIGATNVLRTGRKDLAIITLVMDVSKAGIAALLAQLIFGSYMAGLIAGTAGVIGHNYSIWIGLKGGKGVASTLGMMLATNPAVGLTTALVWLAVAIVFRYSSLAALTALAFSPFFALVSSSPDKITCALFYAALALLAFYQHRGNIKRLREGTETKIHIKKTDDDKGTD